MVDPFSPAIGMAGYPYHAPLGHYEWLATPIMPRWGIVEHEFLSLAKVE